MGYESFFKELEGFVVEDSQELELQVYDRGLAFP